MNKIIQATPITKEYFSKKQGQYKRVSSTVKQPSVSKSDISNSNYTGFYFVSYNAKGELNMSQSNFEAHA